MADALWPGLLVNYPPPTSNTAPAVTNSGNNPSEDKQQATRTENSKSNRLSDAGSTAPSLWRNGYPVTHTSSVGTSPASACITAANSSHGTLGSWSRGDPVSYAAASYGKTI